MKFVNFTIDDLFTRCVDVDDGSLQMDADEFAALRRKIAELEQDRGSWKAQAEHFEANHNNIVMRCALLRQRPDLPVDRIPAYNALTKAQNRNVELEARLIVEIELPPPSPLYGQFDGHATYAAIRRAGFRVAGDAEYVGDVDLRSARVKAVVEDKQRIADLEAKLTLVREQRDNELCTNSELERRLAKPVRLPNINDDNFELCGMFNQVRYRNAVVDAIRASGFLAEGLGVKAGFKERKAVRSRVRFKRERGD